MQIAFEHVWAEVFDDRLTQLGREFYHAYVDLLDFVGNPVDPVTGKPIAPPEVISSIQDITTLIQNASMLGRVADNSTPSTKLSADFMTGYQFARQNLINGFRLSNGGHSCWLRGWFDGAAAATDRSGQFANG